MANPVILGLCTNLLSQSKPRVPPVNRQNGYPGTQICVELCANRQNDPHDRVIVHNGCKLFGQYLSGGTDLPLKIIQTLGYDSSMMSGLNILPQYKNYFHLNAGTTGLVG